jgi:hypothetical protein
VDGGQKAGRRSYGKERTARTHPHMRHSELFARQFLYVVGLWRMALTTGVNVAARPGRVGAPRQSRTTVYSLLARLIRRPGAKDPATSTSPTPPSTGTIAAGGTHPPG